MSGLIWIQSVSIPARIFEKIDFEKNQQKTKKHEKFPRGKELNKNYPHSTVDCYLGLCGPVEMLLYIIFCILFVTHI